MAGIRIRDNLGAGEWKWKEYSGSCDAEGGLDDSWRLSVLKLSTDIDINAMRIVERMRKSSGMRLNRSGLLPQHFSDPSHSPPVYEVNLI
ncbi:hypothetical protein Tco_1435132 [Tanacetum coccineum]